MQKQGKSSPARESSSESSNETPCAPACYCPSCVSTAVLKDEKDVSRSPSVTDKTLTP